MDRFEFFFSFHLGERLYSYTDNLSKTLQACIKMAAVGGQRLANLTKETLTKMRIDQSFDLFYAKWTKSSENKRYGFFRVSAAIIREHSDKTTTD